MGREETFYIRRYFENRYFHFRLWYSGLLHVMKFILLRAVLVFFVLSACRMTRIFPGTLLFQIHPCVVWLSPQALKDAQAVVL